MSFSGWRPDGAVDSRRSFGYARFINEVRMAGSNRRWSVFGVALMTVLALPLVPAAQSRTGGRALAIEDYYRIQTVGNPDISPDGRWVVFSVATRIEEDNSTRTEFYLVPTDASSGARRIVHYGKDITAPSWADDSRLRYSADRQQWTVDPSNASARPVTATTRAAGAVPSADKKWIALAKDKAQPKKDAAAATEFERRHEERFKGVTFDWKDFQRDGQPFPAPNPRARPATQLVIQAATGGDARTLVDADVRLANIAWHPNGSLLAYTADPDWRDEIKYESPDLWTVTTGGNITRLTDDGYVYGDVSFSPDGRYLAYSRGFGTDMIIQQKLNHGGPDDLFIRPVTGGEAVNLTANWDLEPNTAQWSPDSRFIYFTATTGGETQLFRVAASGGAVEQVTKGQRRLNGLTIDRAFKTITYTVGLHETPPEVYAANIDGTNERQLTNVHASLLSEITFSRAERLRWPSYDGTTIEGWLMFPHGYDATKGPYPLIVTSHGGPHSATGYSFDFKDQFFAANGYFVFDTNFRSSTGYGDAFKWATWGEWGKKDGEDVVSGIDYVLKRYPIDAKRVGHTGHSYGGFMTNWLITQYPEKFAAAITGAGITNWISDYGTADIYRTKETEFFGTPWDAAARDRMIKQSPLTYAGNVRTPTLFVHGEVDQRVPYEEGEQMYFALKRRGIPAKMIQYAGQPHGIAGHWNNVHRMLNELKWWNQYLQGPPRQTTTSQQQ
jgi:dipeptidyl aminopeptidase/acylaminoacyl peptidase